ncbi:MAG: sulfatase-like hydrolase/transferase [Vicinamibacteria bacterium]|nr:sulfatase-like hydrolase/transferase [Vicinamibacteria bacterium]
MIASLDSPAPTNTPPLAWRARVGRTALPAAHLLALWAFAVAQPLFDILQRNGEFFIAHRTRPFDLMLFVAVVSVGLPLLLVLPVAILAAAWPRAGRVALTGLIGLLAVALASQMLAHRVPLPTPVHVAVACTFGVALAWAYAARAGVRTFMTMLSPSVLVFPAIFLLHPSMSMFVRADSGGAEVAAVIEGPAPPIVFLIFDQLPLASLMDAHGQIDRDRYPGFAALAEHATWYRNASASAELTGWAVPPIVSGIGPNSTRMPTVKSYPHNLFTWLGGRYRVEAIEPITQLCPERLCDVSRDPLPVRLAGMTADSSVVYLRIALPAGLREHLPPLTESWKGFIRDQRWQRRWVTESQEDRRQVPRDLIASISRDDPQPTLYFAHTLLPHEPYVYLRSGQVTTDHSHMAGLSQTGRWTTDDWPVTQAYRRHLLQVEYVDGVVERVIERLKAEALYDAALIVVTSDHGVSFRPGHPFKGLSTATLPDIMSVPLLIKAPHQRRGVIDDANVQAVDVMPTIASLLNIPLTWTPEGRAGGTGSIAATSKTIHHGGARFQTSVEAALLAQARDAAVARKVALFGDTPGWRATAVRRGDLIGQRVDGLDVTQGPWQVLVDDAARLLAVDPAGPALPVLLAGRVRDARGTPVDAEVVIAVSGVVAAVSRTYRPEDEPRGTWTALVDPALFTKGRNDVRVYVLSPDRDRLHLAYSSRARPEHVNLASRGAAEFWAVTQSGFYPRDGEPIPHRWTTGEGVLVVPIEPEQPAKSLRIGITGIRPGGTPLTVTLNDCTLFSGNADAAPWYRTFPLRTCPVSPLTQPYVTIVVKSPSWVGDGDQRRRGVAVETVNLFTDDWPLEPDADRHARATISIVDGQQIPRPVGTPVPIVVANIGTSIWLSAVDAPTKGQPVQIALRWRQARPGGPTHEQRMDLPHALYPTDRLLVDTPLVPPDALRTKGPWTLTITVIDHDGAPMPVDPAVVVDVTSDHR